MRQNFDDGNAKDAACFGYTAPLRDHTFRVGVFAMRNWRMFVSAPTQSTR
jgi:hypothetical protein